MVGQINMENGATQALIFKRPIEKERTEERKQELEQEDSSDGLFGKMKDMVEEEAERQQNDR
ncbi:hypothetical protein DJ84_09080 [Halorubrum ezzemoulense]|nr:hypothetical protein DJ84_09080 [Halorubrum ezzemoulense]